MKLSKNDIQIMRNFCFRNVEMQAHIAEVDKGQFSDLISAYNAGKLSLEGYILGVHALIVQKTNEPKN